MLAVDLGASSARVAAVDLSVRPLVVEVVHRYEHGPIRVADGSLRWDWSRLVDEVETGLAAGIAAGPVASIGVDTWGVDHGLLDRAGELVSAPYCYRDERTDGWLDVCDRLGAERLYRTTGIQLLGINTIFQLAVHSRDELDRAASVVMLPELLAHTLCAGHTGHAIVTGERTSAGTTGLVDVATGDWAKDLLADLDLEPALFPPIGVAGTLVGTWHGAPVRLVGGHDTASAVAALPVRAGGGRRAFVSSGTWSIVGIERPAADVSDAARAANFSNEPSVFGGVRFLKNVMGLWLLDRCRAGWDKGSLASLLKEAAAVPSGGPVIDVNDARFVAPADMEAELRAAAGLPSSAGRSAVTRCILDSLAVATAAVVGELTPFLGAPVDDVCVIGGGARNGLLNRLIEERCAVPVCTGSPEATALGNALVQGVALGLFGDLDAARGALDAEAA